MTSLLPRPVLRVEPTSQPPTRPVILSAAVAAAVAAGVEILLFVGVSVVAWFASDTGSFGSGIRVGVLAWLVANGGGLHLGGVSITAIPLGLVLVAAWMLHRGGRWAGRHSEVGSLAAVAAGASVMGGVYCAAGIVAYAVTRTGDVHADLLRTSAATVVLGLVFGGWGILRGADLTRRLLERMPVDLRAALTGATAGVGVMLSVGALLVAVSLLRHFSTAVTLAEGLHASAVGAAVMALIGVAAVPNAVLCAGAFAAGPGFVLGTGTGVAPGGVTLGQLPSFPLLAAVPHDVGSAWLQALAAVPVLAGVAAGLTASRRYPAASLFPAAARGGLAGSLGGTAFGLLSWLATGAIGPGRMRDIGPDVVAIVVICVAAGLLGGVVASAGRHWLGHARSRRAAGAPAAGQARRRLASRWGWSRR